jgi:hypothetical protein
MEETRNDSGERRIVITSKDTKSYRQVRLSRDWRREAHAETFKRLRAALWGWIKDSIGSWQRRSFRKELTPKAASVLRENDRSRIIEFSIPYEVTLFILKTVTREIIAKEIIVKGGRVELGAGVSVGPARIQELGMGRLTYQVEPRESVQSDATPANDTEQGRSQQTNRRAQQTWERLFARIGELETAAQSPDLTENEAREIMQATRRVHHELATNNLRRIIPLLKRLGLVMRQVGKLFPAVSFPKETVESLIHADQPKPGTAIDSTAPAQKRKQPRRNSL